MSIWRWPTLASRVAEPYRMTLGEGGSPLILSRKIGPRAGLPRLYFKWEGSNPSGSFKDRFAAQAISHMLAAGKTRCVATSSGNTGSALAAYCASASIDCHIAIVETAPPAKLRQMMAYGAHIFRIRGFGLDPDITSRAFAQLGKLGQQPDSALQISSFKHSPDGMQGVESISFELDEQMPDEVDHVFCPAGGGGLCVAVARGFAALPDPRQRPTAVHCVQPEGNDTIATALRRGEPRARDVDCSTRISGLQVASVVDGNEVIAECRPTGGTGHLVRDEQVWQIQRELAREEGIFCEPAGAVSLAGALNAVAEGLVQANASIVCLITGVGFKDEDSVQRMIQDVTCPLIDIDQLENEVQGQSG